MALAESDLKAIGELFDSRLERVDNRLDSMDNRLGSIENRLESVEGRLDAVDDRFEVVGNRFDSIDERFTKIHDDLLDFRNEANESFDYLFKQAEKQQHESLVINEQLKRIESTVVNHEQRLKVLEVAS